MADSKKLLDALNIPLDVNNKVVKLAKRSLLPPRFNML
jgi:hypothetical protein